MLMKFSQNVVISQVYETGTVTEVPEDRPVEEVELKYCTARSFLSIKLAVASVCLYR